MKKTTTVFAYLALCLIFASCHQTDSSQTTTTSNLPDSSSQPVSPVAKNITAPRSVADIQSLFTEISAKLDRKALDSTTFKYDCNGEKNGTVTYFSENGNLRLIEHRYNEYSHYSATDRYFSVNDTLFFAYQKSTAWSFESGPEGSTRDNITEYRAYLVNSKPVKCLEKKYVIRSQVADKPKPEALPNKATDCSVVKSLLSSYEKLKQYNGKTPPDCLEQ
jgi:hypothetical protein